MAFIIDAKAGKQDVKLDVTMYREAKDANKTVVQHLNSMYDADPKYGTAFQQLCASEGLVLTGKDNPFGLRSPSIAEILDGKSAIMAGSPTNTSGSQSPYGSQSRSLFPAAVIQFIEDQVQPDRVTDNALFRQMVAVNVPIAGDHFIQPLLSYANANGANAGTNGAKASRVVELGQVPMMLSLTTSDQNFSIPTHGIGIEMSDKALKATTLDLLTLTLGRFLDIEKDQRVYTYIANMFAGDLDHNTGAVSSVTTTSLDSAATGGVVTHKSWVKFLARNRKKRKITHVMADIDTYLKVESRTGRPGTTAYDPTLARIDPQALVQNAPFGADVKWMIVDDASAGGPVPANTIYALDASQALMTVSNTEAQYQATEQFVLRRSEVLVIHWSEECFRLYGANDLVPFDILTIA